MLYGQESSSKRGYKGEAQVIWHLSNDCSDIWNGSMGKYKIKAVERNRENTKKGLKGIFQLPVSTTHTDI